MYTPDNEPPAPRSPVTRHNECDTLSEWGKLRWISSAGHVARALRNGTDFHNADILIHDAYSIAGFVTPAMPDISTRFQADKAAFAADPESAVGQRYAVVNALMEEAGRLVKPPQHKAGGRC